MEENEYDFGMIGLGVMGSNLLLNMADHHFSVIGFDKDQIKTQAFEQAASSGTTVKGVNSLADMINQLSRPRKLMMLVPAGKPVDDVINDLVPLLEKDDLIIDGGNSHYIDTLRRLNFLKEKNIHFMGMGISGGEQGARTGPSMMPGGDLEAYNQVKPLLEAIAAKVNDEPCTAYMGRDAAGHYVKMVHNGIEYAMMQLISEAYDLLHRGLGLSNLELHDVFAKWNEGKLQSFLIEITRDIFVQKDELTGNDLIDMILDVAASKGTGKWTSQDALDLPVAIPNIDIAVDMRTLSAYRDERVQAAALYHPEILRIKEDKAGFINQLEDALYFSFILSYAQGLAMLHKASAELKMDIPLQDVVKIWRGGCIIRSVLLEKFYAAYQQDPALPNILLDEHLAHIVQSVQHNVRNVLVQAIKTKISVPGLMSANAYFEAYTCAKMPTNLIQAQRDWFGAHTYKRIDKEGNFHTNWKEQHH